MRSTYYDCCVASKGNQQAFDACFDKQIAIKMALNPPCKDAYKKAFSDPRCFPGDISKCNEDVVPY
jgi:hypothetical protein